MLARVACVVGVVVSCACATTPPPPLPPPPPPPPELPVDATCQVIVDVDDAAAKSALVPVRHALEQRGLTDRVGVFGMLLAEATPEARFKAFHGEFTARPESVVGVLGECIVYGSWARMGPQATSACDAAAERLGSVAVLAEIGRARSALTHRDDVAAATAIIDAALVKAPRCSALIVLRAEAQARRASTEALTGWVGASEALPTCFRCLIESANAAERADATAAGRARAAPLWERALSLAPDHPDTLRRFAATVAGVDDERAQRAYAAAVKAGARDYPTLMAAATLTASVARSAPTEARSALAEEALGYATKAADVAKTDPEPRRLVVTLNQLLARSDAVVAAANGLLLLLPDDPVAHGALARVALAQARVSDAVIHFDAAMRASTAEGVEAVLDNDARTALATERAALLQRLGVDEAKAAKGSASAVAAATQKSLSALWRDHVKTKKATKGGALTVVIETAKAGEVREVQVTVAETDDPDMAAAAVAWLSRATITGGARRYTLDFQLK